MVEASPTSPDSEGQDKPRTSDSGSSSAVTQEHTSANPPTASPAPEDSFAVATAPAPQMRQRNILAQQSLSSDPSHPGGEFIQRHIVLLEDPEHPSGEPIVQINTNVTIPQISDEDLTTEHDLTAEEAARLTQEQSQGINRIMTMQQSGKLFTKRPINGLGLETEQGHSYVIATGPNAPTLYGSPAYVAPEINATSKILFKAKLSPEGDAELLSQIEADPLLRGKLLSEALIHCFHYTPKDPTANGISNLYEKAAIFLLDEIIGSYKGTQLRGSEIAHYRDEIVADLSSGEPERRRVAEELLAKMLNKEETRKRRPLDITGELGADQSEGGSRIYGGGGMNTHRTELTNDQQLQRAVFNVLGAKYGTRPTPSGTSPAKTPEQHLREHITPHPRYDALLKYLRKANDPNGMYSDSYRCPVGISYHGQDWDVTTVQSDLFYDPCSQQIRFHDHNSGNVLTIDGIDVSVESQSTSMQAHVEVDSADKFVELARTADLVSPLLKALAANAPTFVGVQAVQDSRSWAWLPLNANHWDIARPDGSGAGTDWIENELSQILEHSGNHQWVLPLNDAVTKSSSSGGETDEERHIRTALEATKTYWPENRTTFHQTEDGTYEARVEFRGASKGPMPAHDAAIAAFLEAMVEELPAYLEDTYGIDLNATKDELNKEFPYSYVKQNRRQAEGFGLHAHIKWPGREGTVAIKDIIEELLPIVERGMTKRGYTPVDYRQLVGTPERPGVIRRLCGFTLPIELRDDLQTLVSMRLEEFSPDNTLGRERRDLIETFRSSPATFSQAQADRLAALCDEERSLKRVYEMVDLKGFSMADISQFLYHSGVVLEPQKPEVQRSRDLSHYHVLLSDLIEHHYYDEHIRLMRLEGHTIDERPKPDPYDVHNQFLSAYAQLLKTNLLASHLQREGLSWKEAPEVEKRLGLHPADLT